MATFMDVVLAHHALNEARIASEKACKKAMRSSVKKMDEANANYEEARNMYEAAKIATEEIDAEYNKQCADADAEEENDEDEVVDDDDEEEIELVEDDDDEYVDEDEDEVEPSGFFARIFGGIKKAAKAVWKFIKGIGYWICPWHWFKKRKKKISAQEEDLDDIFNGDEIIELDDDDYEDDVAEDNTVDNEKWDDPIRERVDTIRDAAAEKIETITDANDIEIIENEPVEELVDTTNPKTDEELDAQYDATTVDYIATLHDTIDNKIKFKRIDYVSDVVAKFVCAKYDEIGNVLASDLKAKGRSKNGGTVYTLRKATGYSTIAVQINDKNTDKSLRDAYEQDGLETTQLLITGVISTKNAALSCASLIGLTMLDGAILLDGDDIMTSGKNWFYWNGKDKGGNSFDFIIDVKKMGGKHTNGAKYAVTYMIHRYKDKTIKYFD